MRLPYKVKKIQDAQKNFDYITAFLRREVRGVVDGATGAVLVGTEFTASRTGVGRYTVVLKKPFVSGVLLISIMTDTAGGGGIQPSPSITAVTTGFSVVTFNTASVVLDLSWSFSVRER